MISDGMIAGMLLFMVMPYIIVLGIGGGLLRAHRRNREAEEQKTGGN